MGTMQPPAVPLAPSSGNTLAVWSLVLGILSVTGCFMCLGIGGLLFAIPAVICGHLARAHMKRSGRREYDGLSLAGIITGYIALGIGIMLSPLLLAIAIPSFVHARERSMQNACAANLRMITMAKDAYAADHKGAAPASLDEITGPMLYLNQRPACPEKGEYIIGGGDENPTCSIHGEPTAKRPRVERDIPVEK